MIHPLSAWLIGRRLHRADRAAEFGLGGGLIILAICCRAWLEAQVALLETLLLLGLLVMILVPPVVAALTGALTALELRGEHFQFLLLTSLPERTLAQGLLHAALYRTRHFRAMAAAAIPAVMIGFLVELLKVLAPFWMYMSYPAPSPPPDVTLPGLLLAVVVGLLWGANVLAARLGAAVALRWPNAALAAALAPAAMLALVAVPFLVLTSLVWAPLGCLAGPYLLFRLGRYLLGGRLLRDAARWMRQID